MYSLRFSAITLLVLLTATNFNAAAHSQSTVVSVDSQRRQIPNSLAPAVRRTEQLLNRSTPLSWQATMTLENLIQSLNQTGLAVAVGDSAKGNGLNPRTPIRMALRNASLAENLRFALLGRDCDFTISELGTIIIDDKSNLSGDGGNFLAVTYNLDQVVQDLQSAEALKNLLSQSISFEDWDDYGGAGQMVILNSEKGYLLTVSQTWRHQQRVRDFLERNVVLGGRLKTPANEVASTGVSRPVELPENYRSLRRNRKGISLPGSGSTSGFGGGGAVRGGGVF